MRRKNFGKESLKPQIIEKKKKKTPGLENVCNLARSPKGMVGKTDDQSQKMPLIDDGE